jgi:hypothetical protein
MREEHERFYGKDRRGTEWVREYEREREELRRKWEGWHERWEREYRAWLREREEIEGGKP